MTLNDIIAGDFGTGAAPSVGAVYTDSATVKRVQKALNISVDGKIGPQTKAAVKAFNTQRGFSGDGENITDGTLAAIAGLEYTASQTPTVLSTPSVSKPSVMQMPAFNVSPSAATTTQKEGEKAEQPGLFSTPVPGLDLPLWQVLLGALGLTAIGVGVYGALKR